MQRSGFIDFHTHTLNSDGELGPAELVARARRAGYACLGLADHADSSSLEPVLAAALETARAFAGRFPVIPGVELTYVPPDRLPAAVALARQLGARCVVVHGESPAEPAVPAGTNAAAIRAGADILAHPGLLAPGLARLAARRGVALELTCRRGHSQANGHVARTALAAGAALVLDTDAHAAGDLMTGHWVTMTLRGAGLTAAQAGAVLRANAALARRLLRGMEGAR